MRWGKPGEPLPGAAPSGNRKRTLELVVDKTYEGKRNQEYALGKFKQKTTKTMNPNTIATDRLAPQRDRMITYQVN